VNGKRDYQESGHHHDVIGRRSILGFYSFFFNDVVVRVELFIEGAVAGVELPRIFRKDRVDQVDTDQVHHGELCDLEGKKQFITSVFPKVKFDKFFHRRVGF
jgi:hypothetical protein